MRFLIIILLVTSLVACQSEKPIEESAVDRWQAIIDGDYETAYDYLVPSYQEIETLQSYSIRLETAKIHTQWKKAEFVSKDCEKEVCDVTLKIHFEYSFPRKSMGKTEMFSRLHEKWLNKDGSWYHVPDKL